MYFYINIYIHDVPAYMRLVCVVKHEIHRNKYIYTFLLTYRQRYIQISWHCYLSNTVTYSVLLSK